MYHYLLTSLLEVSVIWESKRSGTTILFFINRYLFFIQIVADSLEEFLITYNIKGSALIVPSRYAFILGPALTLPILGVRESYFRGSTNNSVKQYSCIFINALDDLGSTVTPIHLNSFTKLPNTSSFLLFSGPQTLLSLIFSIECVVYAP